MTMNAAETESRLAAVRQKLAEVRTGGPQLSERLAKASKVLGEAKLAAEVAIGSPGFEDDIKAAESVSRAQAELDRLLEERDSVEDRIETLSKAEKHLEQEVQAARSAHLVAAVAAARTDLQAKIDQLTPAMLAWWTHVAALRDLNGATTWESEAGHIISIGQRVNLQQSIDAGHRIADRVRGGGKVSP